MYTILFQFDADFSDIKPILEDYSWWVALVRKVASGSDTFEIRCWNDEPEAIQIGKRYGEQIENETTQEFVFKGPLSETFLEEICENGLDEKGALKYFTINFYHGDKLLFHSGHYGTEPVIFVKTKEDAQQLEEWSRHYPIIRRVDLFHHEI